jgi:NADH:ubiquinone oxidoreductase subunit F (NADH-binding)
MVGFRVDFHSLKGAQTDLGAGTVAVMDKSTDIVTDIARFAHVRISSSSPSFFAHYASSSASKN